MAWSPEQIPDQSGRTAVVTGANTGLGLRTTLHLARRGARVVLACRDAGRAASAVGRVRAEVPDADVEARDLDLSDLASVRDFAATWAGPLDLLVNNAGVMAVPPNLTADGFESQIGINHLGHFALTGLLLPALREAPSARVVAVSSVAHRSGRIHADTFTDLQGYRPWTAYSQSKLANLLMIRHLSARLVAGGETVLAAAAHPGVSTTELTRSLPRPVAVGADLAGAVIGVDDEHGAWPQLHAATMPDVVPDDYLGPRLMTRGATVRVGRATAARDDAVAAVLWARSEELTGVSYPDLAPHPGAP